MSEKTTHFSESVKDRPAKSHEYLFLLTKSSRYYYDADAVREPGLGGDLRNKRTIWRLPRARLNAQDFGIDHVHSYPQEDGPMSTDEQRTIEVWADWIELGGAGRLGFLHATASRAKETFSGSGRLGRVR